jgi:hypothetical protein
MSTWTAKKPAKKARYPKVFRELAERARRPSDEVIEEAKTILKVQEQYDAIQLIEDTYRPARENIHEVEDYDD